LAKKNNSKRFVVLKVLRRNPTLIERPYEACREAHHIYPGKIHPSPTPAITIYLNFNNLTTSLRIPPHPGKYVKRKKARKFFWLKF
jgi:hypothetical protein